MTVFRLLAAVLLISGTSAFGETGFRDRIAERFGDGIAANVLRFAAIPNSLAPEATDLGSCRFGTDRPQAADERSGQFLQCQTSTVATEVGYRRFDHVANALFAHQFGQPHHDRGIRDLLANPDAAPPSSSPSSSSNCWGSFSA